MLEWGGKSEKKLIEEAKKSGEYCTFDSTELSADGGEQRRSARRSSSAAAA